MASWRKTECKKEEAKMVGVEKELTAFEPLTVMAVLKLLVTEKNSQLQNNMPW